MGNRGNRRFWDVARRRRIPAAKPEHCPGNSSLFCRRKRAANCLNLELSTKELNSAGIGCCSKRRSGNDSWARFKRFSIEGKGRCLVEFCKYTTDTRAVDDRRTSIGQRM